MSRAFATVIAWLTFLLVADATFQRSSVNLVKNGYENLVVAIAETVPDMQSAKAIANIKAMFTDASNELFIATQHRVYFRNITIVVPKSWKSKKDYKEATTESFATADIIIDGNERGGMSTRSYGICGKEGLSIRIPKSYLTNDLSTFSSGYGTPGRTIVQEWGHFWWGLGDEYPVRKSGFKSFYFGPNRTIKAVKCGKNMNGRFMDRNTKKNCNISSVTGLPTSTCRFYEDKTNPGVSASLMFYHWIPKVVTFCDSDVNNTASLHNDDAPSKHNEMCKYKSCWQVMRGHKDFHNGNSPVLPASHNTKPTFRIVQGKSKQFVLVLDVSRSMSKQVHGVSRIQKLRQTAADFLLNAVPLNYSVGIVTFSSGAYTVSQLTKITNATVRRHLASKLPSGTGGTTAIGSGLLTGVEVLEANGGSASGGTLILVSDGGENKAPTIRAVTPTLKKKSVTVHTILISNNADAKLVKLAADTKGKSFFDTGSIDTTDLLSAFRSTVNDEDSGSPGAAPVEILLESLWIAGNDVVNKSMSIDSSVGRNTEFTFSYPGTTFTLDVVVISPSGVNYTAGHDTKATKQLTIAINDTEVGLWTVVLRNLGSTSTNTQLLVTSMAPSDDSYPIRLWTHLSHQEVNFKDPSTLKLIVRADLRKGYEPVIGAKVEVQVGSLPWKPMTDDGLGVDEIGNDGFYSAALLQFSGNGKFPVKVRATSKEGDKTQLVVGGGTLSAYLPDGDVDETEPTYEAVGQFQRTKAAGLVKVVNLTPNTDLYALYPFPPAEVRYLRFIAMSYDDKTVTLQWTAVGDYVDQETASSYDIRFSTDIKQLLHFFENATQLDDSDVIKGNLTSPASPSETETFVVRFRPHYLDSTLFFGLKVTHSRGRVSGVSNIVSAAIVYVPPEETYESSGFFTTAVGIACAVAALFLVVIGVALWVVRKRCINGEVAAQQE
ncbi:hypothetical protein NP493_711g03078 [Ridgeia piscesae]|uniref:VWFA domain-containing protein n=1 Tax=Ridgeia piscesae TaxID=27915 RepID=A0AAD9NMS2_RIDPI|nr:hypothetical protein NP493_711g03078 [Ridgeia piscesae]